MCLAHTTAYYISVLILLYMCPRATTYASACRQAYGPGVRACLPRRRCACLGDRGGRGGEVARGFGGTHFTCFTSTNAQILTPEELREASSREASRAAEEVSSREAWSPPSALHASTSTSSPQSPSSSSPHASAPCPPAHTSSHTSPPPQALGASSSKGRGVGARRRKEEARVGMIAFDFHSVCGKLAFRYSVYLLCWYKRTTADA